MTHMPSGTGFPQAPERFGIDVASLYGLDSTGTADDTERLQDAIDDNPGRMLWLRKGEYRFTETLSILERHTHIVGESRGRAAEGGTQMSYEGTGAAIEIGTDNSEPWDDNDYDGPQGHLFAHFTLNHTARDTNLGLPGGASGATYKAGSYGIRDWRGGDVRLTDFGVEGFEYNFWGVQSDLNRFSDIISLYSKYGIYLGPRSDQCIISDLHSFFCERVLTIDRASQCRLIAPEIIFCGKAGVQPVEIRKGSSAVNIYAPWLENADAAEVATLPGWIGAGLVDGYGPSGVGTTPTSAQGISVQDPMYFTSNSGGGTHQRTIVAVGAALGVRVYNPTPRLPNTLNTLESFIEAPSGTAFTNAQSQSAIYGVPNTAVSAFLNSGTGTPRCSVAVELVDTFLIRKTADYTVKLTDRLLIMSGSAGAVTFTLPAAPLDGQECKFGNHDAANDLVLARNGLNINGAASNKTLTPGQRTTLFYVAGQTSWFEVG